MAPDIVQMFKAVCIQFHNEVRTSSVHIYARGFVFEGANFLGGSNFWSSC